jgi:hypothetical protein
MALPESIRRAWLATDYRVRLPGGGYANIHCGQPLPLPLQSLLASNGDPWGYITAWNPGAVRLPLTANRARQRRLRDTLKSLDLRWYGGVGVGPGGWREASLFVPGIRYARLDELARHFGQLGVVRGAGTTAELHPLD